MDYKEELTKAMTMLGEDDRTLFLGQSVAYPGQAMFATLSGVPMEKRLELPIFEETQMGMSIGLSLMGYLPITLYTRMNFLLLAMNQLVNHLDKIASLSDGEFQPRVIIRTMVGAKQPLNGGPQHTGDYAVEIRDFIPNIRICQLCSPQRVVPYYTEALNERRSCLMIEYESDY